MAGFHTKIKFSKYDFKDSQFTVVLATGITSADVGKAVSQDTGAANKVKLAGDGDEIIGILYTVEDRINEGQLVGTVEFRFAADLPVKTGLTGEAVVAIGKRLIGAGAGEVKAIDFSGTPTAIMASKYAVAPIVWDYNGTTLKATATQIT